MVFLESSPFPEAPKGTQILLNLVALKKKKELLWRLRGSQELLPRNGNGKQIISQDRGPFLVFKQTSLPSKGQGTHKMPVRGHGTPCAIHHSSRYKASGRCGRGRLPAQQSASKSREVSANTGLHPSVPGTTEQNTTKSSPSRPLLNSSCSIQFLSLLVHRPFLRLSVYPPPLHSHPLVPPLSLVPLPFLFPSKSCIIKN